MSGIGHALDALRRAAEGEVWTRTCPRCAVSWDVNIAPNGTTASPDGIGTRSSTWSTVVSGTPCGCADGPARVRYDTPPSDLRTCGHCGRVHHVTGQCDCAAAVADAAAAAAAAAARYSDLSALPDEAGDTVFELDDYGDPVTVGRAVARWSGQARVVRSDGQLYLLADGGVVCSRKCR